MLFDKAIWTKIRTTNQTERTNRKFRKKQKTHYRIRSKIKREKLIDFIYYFHNHNTLKLNSKIKLVIVKSNNCIFIIIFSDYKFFSKIFIF